MFTNQVAELAALQGFVNGDGTINAHAVLTGTAQEVGMTDHEIFEYMTEAELMDYEIDEKDLDRAYEVLFALIAEKDEPERELFHDVSPATYEDNGFEDDLNTMIEVQEDMATLMVPLKPVDALKSKLLVWGQRLENRKAQIKEADYKAGELQAKLDEAKAGKRITRNEWDAILSAKLAWQKRANKLVDMAHNLGEMIRVTWDKVHAIQESVGAEQIWEQWKELQAISAKGAESRPGLWEAYFTLKDFEFNLYFTYGEVDEEVDNRMLWSENLNRGEDLAWDHVREMREQEAFIEAPIQSWEEPRVREYAGTLTHHWVKGDVSETEFVEVPADENDEGYINALMNEQYVFIS